MPETPIIDFVARASINVVAMLLLVFGMYYQRYRDKELAIAAALFNIFVFSLLVILSSVEFGVGTGFGLFAILALFTLRSEQITKTEITYFFGSIAIAVICENSDQGARVAAPIASLMIEKYLKDSIRGAERQAMEVEYTNRVYIPPVMRMEIAKKDSLKKVKENEQLLQQKLNKKEADDSTADESLQPEPEPKTVTPPIKNIPVPKRKADKLTAALLIDERKNKKTNSK